MDPYEDAPLVASIAANYAFVNEPPPSTPVTLPPLTSGTETFESIEAVMERVRELHQVLDPDVAPHRSKYAARIIMVRGLTQRECPIPSAHPVCLILVLSLLYCVFCLLSDRHPLPPHSSSYLSGSG